jgi:arylsulfatase A-like enzyme
MRAFLNGHISSFKESLEGIRKDYGTIPDVSAVQLLGTDLFSHYPFEEPRKWHVSMDNIQKYYARAVLDPLVGELTSSLKRMGSYENTIFAIVSDHGFTPIARLIRNEIFGESLELQFHLPSWRRTNRQADAVIMPGAGTKEIYLKNRRSEEWIDPPRLLADVKVAVDLLLDNPEVLECMGELLIRQYPGERHEGVTEDDTWWVFDWRGYPGGASRDDQAFLSALRPLSALASRFELGEYIVQGVRNQYTRQTAPDIQLITKKGSYFENDTDKYGHHGSYYPDDCTVSFWLCGPGLARVAPGRHVIDRTISTLDLVPMVTRLLGIPIPAGLDGVDPLAEIAEIKEGITGPWKPAATVPNSPSGPMTGSR